MDNSGGFAPPPPPPPPPPGGSGGGGGGGGDVLQPRGLGDILTAAFEIYKANAAKLIVIVAILVVPLQFVLHLITGLLLAAKKQQIMVGTISVTTLAPRSKAVIGLAALLVVLISVIIYCALQAAITRAAAQTTVGEPVDVAESYKFGFKNLGAVLAVGIAVAVAIAVSTFVGLLTGPGVLLFVALDIFLLTMLAVAVPAVVIERHGAGAAMSRSWGLAKGNFWHVLGTVFVAAFLAGIVSGLIGLIGGSNWFLGWIFGSIGSIITAPFTALVTVLLYLDLRTRAENLTASQLRSELAQT